MDRLRRTARKIRELHVTDSKANKVSRGRTTKFVTSRKVCCACSGMLAIRHRWFCILPEDAVWLKGDAPSCNKTMKTRSYFSGLIEEAYVIPHGREFYNVRPLLMSTVVWVSRRSRKSRLTASCLFTKILACSEMRAGVSKISILQTKIFALGLGIFGH